jgi:DNA polymerase-3 subunit gamma/tau
MRDAESTLDQLISFCGDRIEEPDVLSMFGLAAQNQILKLAHAILAGEIAAALTELDELARGGKDLGRLLGDLLNHFRNLLIYQVSKGDLNLLEASEAEVAALKEQSALATTDTFTRILEVLADAELRLRDAASKKILLEVSLLRAIEARKALPLDMVLKQLNQLRNQGGPAGSQSGANGASPSPSPAAKPTHETRPVAAEPPEHRATALREAALPPSKPAAETPAPPAPAPAPLSGTLNDLWFSLIEAVGRVSPFTRGYLLDAHPVSFVKNVLVIGFDPEFEDHLGLVDNSRNHTLLATKLSELGHAQSMIKFILAEAPAGWTRQAPAFTPGPAASPAKPVARAETSAAQVQTANASPVPAPVAEKKTASVPFNKEDFKNDPLIQKALEVFKGTIVEVRA